MVLATTRSTKGYVAPRSVKFFMTDCALAIHSFAVFLKTGFEVPGICAEQVFMYGEMSIIVVLERQILRPKLQIC
jgi:hypothetical protein